MTDRPKLPIGMCYRDDLPVEPLPKSPPFKFEPIRPNYSGTYNNNKKTFSQPSKGSNNV